jgi:SOS-response transcriptional repressor LexA
MPRKVEVDGNKITQAREALGKHWSQNKLAEALTHAGIEVSRDQVANWESGRTRSLPVAAINPLSVILEKPATYFAVKTELLEDDRRGIPVVGVVNAEHFNFSFDNPPETYLPLKLDMPGSRRAVALRISGDCMVDPADPRGSLYPGDYVIIVEQKECPNGTVAVIRLNGEYTLKKVYRVKDGYELRPTNPKYKPIIVKGDIEIVGIKMAKYSP